MRALGARSILRAGAVPLLLALGLPRLAAAQWSTNPTVNTPVCTFGGAQLKSVAVSDGAGGVIVAWADNRGPAPAAIYAQHFDAAGNPTWVPVDGVPVCTAVGDQDNPAICSDGLGGAIISWDDFRGPTWDLYAQRVSAAGAVMWAVNGVLVGTDPAPLVPTEEIWSMLVPDGIGGAFVTWESGAGVAYDIRAQRLTAATGAPAPGWPPGPVGLPVCVAAGGQFMPMLVRSGPGVIISWYDSGVIAPNDIYAQRVTGGGALLWPLRGLPVCAFAGDQQQPNIASDGADGAIITWYDSRAGGANLDIYAQHVLVGGVLDPLWPPPGLPVCTVPASNQQWPKIVSDGAGGGIITWYDARAGAGADDIYAQRVTGTGAFPWGAAGFGIPVCTAPGAQDRAKIVSDAAGGAIIAWRDGRAFVNTDIYAQRLNGATGAGLWAPGGIPISTAPLDQDWWDQHVPMIADGTGGAIITWTDSRVGPPFAPPTDIYAQRVADDGTLGGGTFVNRVSYTPLAGFGGVLALAGTDGSAVMSTTGAVTLTRFDDNGEPQWARSYSIPAPDVLMAAGLARMPDGWIVAGNLWAYPPNAGTTPSGMVMRLNESGDVLWAEESGPWTEAAAILRAADGGIALAGIQVTIVGPSGEARAYLTKLDADGTWQWTTLLDSPVADSRPDAITQMPNGDFLIAGIAWMNPYERIFLARFDDAGTLLWARAYTIDAKSAGGPLALSPTPGGGFVLGASLYLSGVLTPASRLMLAEFDSDGGVLWANSMEDGEPIYRSVGVSADAAGAYLCSVLNPGFQSTNDAVVIRAGTGGTFEWLRRLRRAGDFANAGGLAPVDGGVLVTGGLTGGPSGPQVLLAKITADGETCAGSLEVPATNGISLVEIDPQLTSQQVTPTYNAFTPDVTTHTFELTTCPTPLAVGPVLPWRPQMETDAIGVRVTSPASDRMTCQLALPRPVTLRGQWFDLHGRRIGGAFEIGDLPAGNQAVPLARPNVGNGVYVLEVRGGGMRGLAKVVLLR